jgi:hypothetical protein
MVRKLIFLAFTSMLFNTVFAQEKNKHKNKETQALTIPGSAFIRPISDEPKVNFDYKQIDAPLPKFEIIDYMDQNITKNVLEAKSKLVLMMFNPVCGHCEDQTKMFLQHLDSTFINTNFLLIASSVQRSNLSYFNTNVQFSGHSPRLVVGIDSAKVIDKLYHYVELPQINIYDAKTLRLEKTFNGYRTLDSLKMFLN